MMADKVLEPTVYSLRAAPAVKHELVFHEFSTKETSVYCAPFMLKKIDR